MSRITQDRETDNRDMEEMVRYLEARVEALSSRLHELEHENAELRKELWCSSSVQIIGNRGIF